MPRLFTGLQIPEDISNEIAQFRGGLPGARWVEPADYHVTLRFIGDVGLPLAREIDAGLDGLDYPALAIRITGLDSFGGRKPRAIIATVQASADLTALQSAHERTIRRAGGEDDTRKFLPHVTIARLRNVQPQAVGDYLHVRSIARTWQFTAKEFVLFSARDSVGGGPYRVEAVYPLRAVAPALRPAVSQ